MVFEDKGDDLVWVNYVVGVMRVWTSSMHVM